MMDNLEPGAHKHTFKDFLESVKLLIKPKEEEYTYPVISQELTEPLPYSKSNYLFEPLPYLAKDDFRNKNRHPWSAEDISSLIKEEFKEDTIRPQQHFVILKEYKHNESKKIGSLLFPVASIEHRWHIGRVVAIGPLAFDHKYFPAGSSCTYGDWVVYSRTDTLRIDSRSGAYLLVQDKNIMNQTIHPIDLMSQ